jgi:hypothetical protein
VVTPELRVDHRFLRFGGARFATHHLDRGVVGTGGRGGWPAEPFLTRGTTRARASAKSPEEISMGMLSTAQMTAPVLALLALLACAGPAGSDGPPGTEGTAGPQGTAGPAGPKGPSGDANNGDAGVTNPAGCLSPCHGFNGVVEQFKTSVHYSTYLVDIGTDQATEWTANGSACGNCHASDALEQRVAGTVGTPSGGTVEHPDGGQLEYRTTTGSVTDATYVGDAAIAEVGCTTCHDATDANDPHITGKDWTPGSFPQRVAVGTHDQALLEKSPTADASTGSPAGAMGAANTCVWCHKSRKDVTNYIGASNVLTSTHWGPHEGPQADVFSAKGGYEFAGKTYGTATHQIKLTCIDCHMPDVASNRGVPDHSFAPSLSACQGCHTGTTTFDVNGGQSLITSAMGELQGALNGAGYLTRSAAAPYASLQPSEIADSQFDLDQPLPSAVTLTAPRAGALYNYILVARGGALGVHNPKYVQQILYDSYFAMTGMAPTSIPRPE